MYDFDWPEGMTISEFRQHPLTETLTTAAHGQRGLPTVAQVDALNLSPSDRAEFIRECKRVAKVYDSGEQQDARDEANHVASDFLHRLKPAGTDPYELLDGPADPHDSMSPDELAEQVRRF